jgi:hypothetical protein
VRTHWENVDSQIPKKKHAKRTPMKSRVTPVRTEMGPPKGHANGEVDGGFPIMVEEHIPIPHGAEVSRRSDGDQK